MSKSSEAVKKWRSVTKIRMVDAMGGKCQCCGYDRCNNSLAFHHLDPAQKENGFGDIRSNPSNWINIVEELRKCILVCHNCHSEIHAGIRGIPDVYNTFNEEFLDYKASFEAEYDNCSICNNKKTLTRKFCSAKCAATNKRKVDWDSIDLLQLMKDNTITQLVEKLGISNAAIYKRRDKILKQNIPC
jgi:hypothetical protein